MKLESYWHDTATRFGGAAKGPVQGHVEVAVIGGGFTGLAAARRLAKGGTNVALLEARHVGYGASGRNGGHVNNGLSHSYLAAKAALGKDRARALYRALDAAVDTVETIVGEEGIDCDFRRCGKLKLASKPSHFDTIRRNFEAIHREVDPDTELLGPSDLKGEIGSDAFHGAMLSRKSAMMHMGRYVHGLAGAVVRHGGVVHEDAPVTGCERRGAGWVLTTPRGRLSADKVLLATDAYTQGPFAYFRRRVVPVGSFIIATRPLNRDEVAATMLGNRTCVTSLNIGNYFRLSPDDRLIFGGRARFSAVSNAVADQKSGKVLRRSMAAIFPHLADIRVDYCWGGLVGMTKDRHCRAGEVEGLYYAMGYSGHGAQMANYMGEVMADMMTGRGDRNPTRGMDWPPVPMHFGKPWFLPLVGAWFRMKDRMS